MRKMRVGVKLIAAFLIIAVIAGVIGLVAARTPHLTKILLLAAGLVVSVVIAVIASRSITKPVKVTAGLLEKIAQGLDTENLDENKFSGEFRQVAHSLNSVRESLHLLLADSKMIIRAAEEGELSTRADLSRHQGEYREIIGGFNKVLDAFTAPINEAAQVLSRIAEGSERNDNRQFCRRLCHYQRCGEYNYQSDTRHDL